MLKQRQLPTRRKYSTKKVVRIRHIMPTPKQTAITYYTLEPKEARRRIQEYIHNHPSSMTSKIIDSLRINPEQVMEILNQLKREKLVYSRPVE